MNFHVSSKIDLLCESSKALFALKGFIFEVNIEMINEVMPLSPERFAIFATTFIKSEDSLCFYIINFEHNKI